MYKVLVFDDKPSQVELLCTMLSKFDIECFRAYSGNEAIAIAKQKQPHLILMDWIMPTLTLTGGDATRQILGDDETFHIPVIACSAASNLGDALTVGCVDCLPKPFNLSSLIGKIRQYLN